MKGPVPSNMTNGGKGLQSNDLKIDPQNGFYFGKNANVLFVLYIYKFKWISWLKRMNMLNEYVVIDLIVWWHHMLENSKKACGQ